MDLVIFYSAEKSSITYYINNDSAGYKIEYPFSYIKNITLESGDQTPNANGVPTRPGGLVIEMTRPPNFFMDSSGQGGFYQCGDFTEDQQASRVMVHHLGGQPKDLSGQLAKLVSLESFRNRHNPFEPVAFPASAPVSPIGHRPASQPNHMGRPAHSRMFQDSGFPMGMNPGYRGPAGPGHKRTRSRSVPIAIDFSFLQQPMPSFHIQHPSTHITDPSIFAPVPQHQAQFGGPLGPNLRIDTSSGYGMDYRQQPMSATTASPSEFASPGFMPHSMHSESMPPPSHFQPYSLPFLSPSPMADPAHSIPQSASPFSDLSHHDPVIADQSPPMMHRSASADIFSRPDGQGSISDDGWMLSEMYSKQNLNLPMHSPALEEPHFGMPGQEMQEMHEMHEMQENPSSEDIDFKSMVQYGTVDPSNLSPQNNGM